MSKLIDEVNRKATPSDEDLAEDEYDDADDTEDDADRED
jgi:hypothetical protein